MTAADEMRAYYATRAPYYDDVYARPERADDIAFLARYLPARLAARRVLEVACGTGYWTQHIAPHARAGRAGMVASDATAEPLAIARTRPGTAHVAFEQVDAYALPPRLGTFDAAFAGLWCARGTSALWGGRFLSRVRRAASGAWVSHVPIVARGAFLAGLHARLGPGARVILLDNNVAQLRDFPIAETDAEGNTYQQRVTKDGTTHRVLKNFPGEAEMRVLLAAHSAGIRWIALRNFWLVEYDLAR